jgi:hypothetical protein
MDLFWEKLRTLSIYSKQREYNNKTSSSSFSHRQTREEKKVNLAKKESVV